MVTFTVNRVCVCVCVYVYSVYIQYITCVDLICEECLSFIVFLLFIIELPRHTSHQSESDEKQHGNYSKSVSDDFQLVIPQTAQEAQISIGSEIIVPCHLTPEICAIAMQIKWFKETDCVCIYKKGHVIEGRSYKDRASLDTHVLGRGNVSLHLNNFSVSDVGDYYCQVISGDRTQQITVGVRIKPEVQPASQSPTFQGQSIQLMLFEIDKIWTEVETGKMHESALMSEMKVNSVQELHQMMIRAYREGCLNWS
uniref:Ig-like domain-containing protein n=1 Tax=Cyprinus carpio TaxID=7962 RepID=A0A8C2FXG6_CYPCA